MNWLINKIIDRLSKNARFQKLIVSIYQEVRKAEFKIKNEKIKQFIKDKNKEI